MRKAVNSLLIILLLSSSCAVKKAQEFASPNLEIVQTSFHFNVPGNQKELIEQRYTIALQANPNTFSVDSLVMKDGKVELSSNEDLKLWEGSLLWNFLGESQVQAGDTAYLFVSKKGEVFKQVVVLSKEEDRYLP
jgi:hypothetical protein